MRVIVSLASLLLMVACHGTTTIASYVYERNREFNNLTRAAESSVFNHSSQATFGQLIGLVRDGSPKGALFCRDGVCEDVCMNRVDHCPA